MKRAKRAKPVIAWALTFCLTAGTALGFSGGLKAKAEGDGGLLLDASPEESADFDEDNVISRYAVMSDTHIREAADHTSNRLFDNALKAAKALTGGSLDAVLLAGDLVEGYGGPEIQAAHAKAIIEANLDPAQTEFIIASGNHDYYLLPGLNATLGWADYLGGDFLYQAPVEGNTQEEILRGNYHTVRNGIHIITVFGYDGEHPASDVAWLERQLEAASSDTPDMPILVISHVQAAGSLDNNEPDAADNPSRWVSTTIVPVLEKYPQVVYMAGHTHAVSQVRRYNDIFVAVGTGSLQDKQNMLILEVDADGNVRIRNYAISADSEGTGAPLFESVFATPIAPAEAPGDQALAQTTVPAADILDVDFSDGTAGDAAGDTPFAGAERLPSIAVDGAVEKNVADFSATDTAVLYRLSRDQLAAMADGVTMELTVFLEDAPESGETVLYGSEDFSLSYSSGGELVFRAGAVRLASGKVDAGKWVHAAVSWADNDLRMYVDGLRADLSRADLFAPAAEEVFLGGGEGSRAAVTVSNFRIYGEALDSVQAYVLASRSLNTRILFPDDAVFRVVKGTRYVIPIPSASDAGHDTLEVSVSGLDKFGGDLFIRDGGFTPYNAGEYTLLYRANGLLVTRTVEVVEAGDASAAVTLDADKITLAAGETAALKATVSVVGETVAWSSSDPSVVSVDNNGVVTGLKAGTAVVTAKLDNGRSASCTVTVTADGGSETPDDAAGDHGDKAPDTGETTAYAFGFASLLLSAVLLIFARKKTA